ncbi:MAG: acyl-CoA thioesterase [Candidatus Rokubacteria bacterium]|nr:acyl-CoA thioesterase [Candidatus Rokubacteria bacterium]
METVFPIAVRSTDLDGLRHVNNAVYFQYFEQARLAHLARLGFLPTYVPGEGPRHAIAIAETTCRYRAPAYYGDTLLVTVRTREVRRRSFSLTYEVRRQADGVLVAEGESAQVWIDEHERPAPLPDGVRESLEASLGA